MTNRTISRIHFDLVGEKIRGGQQTTHIIGSGDAYIEPSGLSDKTRFVITVAMAPLLYNRCALVPRTIPPFLTAPALALAPGDYLPAFMHTQFRVCDSSQKTEGGDFKFGIGRLIPSQGIFHKTSHYYLLEPEEGQLLWKCGRFVAYLDPRPTEDFFTFSEASTRVDDEKSNSPDLDKEVDDLFALFAATAA